MIKSTAGKLLTLHALNAVLAIGFVFWLYLSGPSGLVLALALMAIFIAFVISAMISGSTLNGVWRSVESLFSSHIAGVPMHVPELQSIIAQAAALQHKCETAEEKLKVSEKTIRDNEDEIQRLSSELNAALNKESVLQPLLDDAKSKYHALAEGVQSILLLSQDASVSAAEGKEVTGVTVRAIEDIGHSVNETSDLVQQLGNRSTVISQVVSTISKLADQTNLLALNAAIEAARAGEQGRGFAVVADEVRKLAERTQTATKEIGSIVAQIQSDTSNAEKSAVAGANKVVEGVNLAKQTQERYVTFFDAFTMVNEMLAQSANDFVML